MSPFSLIDVTHLHSRAGMTHHHVRLDPSRLSFRSAHAFRRMARGLPWPLMQAGQAMHSFPVLVLLAAALVSYAVIALVWLGEMESVYVSISLAAVPGLYIAVVAWLG